MPNTSNVSKSSDTSQTPKENPKFLPIYLPVLLSCLGTASSDTLQGLLRRIVLAADVHSWFFLTPLQPRGLRSMWAVPSCPSTAPECSCQLQVVGRLEHLQRWKDWEQVQQPAGKKLVGLNPELEEGGLNLPLL